MCQVVRTKISIPKFFDTIHNGIVKGKYSTKISVPGISEKAEIVVVLSR